MLGTSNQRGDQDELRDQTGPGPEETKLDSGAACGKAGGDPAGGEPLGIGRGLPGDGQDRAHGADFGGELRLPAPGRADEAVQTVLDDRTVRACILGAVVFAAFTLFFMYLYAVLDTSIYIPIEFERRFGMPMELPDKKEIEAFDVLDSVYIREQEDGTCVLYVKSGGHNRTLVEKTLRDLQNKGETVSRVVLARPDAKLIRRYYKTWGKSV